MRASFVEALVAGPPSNLDEDAALYAFLVGRWRFDARVFRDDGTIHEDCGEIYAAWTLTGRAVQDVWILPGVFHGTTLRVYDATIQGWHILWSDPVRQYYSRQIGRARGRDIVQDGVDGTGTKVRWSFTEMTGDAFLWRGERAAADGVAWRTQAEFRVRRV